MLVKSSLLFFRNALSLSMLTAIRSNLLHNVDCDLRVIILSANGGVFSSGHDLKELVRQLVLIHVVVSNLVVTQSNLPLMILDYELKLFMSQHIFRYSWVAKLFYYLGLCTRKIWKLWGRFYLPTSTTWRKVPSCWKSYIVKPLV